MTSDIKIQAVPLDQVSAEKVGAARLALVGAGVHGAVELTAFRHVDGDKTAVLFWDGPKFVVMFCADATEAAILAEVGKAARVYRSRRLN